MQIEPEGMGQWLQGGGLLAFAGAVWWQVREVAKVMTRVLELLAVLEERTRPVEAAPVEIERDETLRHRRRLRSAPRGYQVPRIRPGDTDEDPGGR